MRAILSSFCETQQLLNGYNCPQLFDDDVPGSATERQTHGWCTINLLVLTGSIMPGATRHSGRSFVWLQIDFVCCPREHLRLTATILLYPLDVCFWVSGILQTQRHRDTWDWKMCFDNTRRDKSQVSGISLWDIFFYLHLLYYAEGMLNPLRDLWLHCQNPLTLFFFSSSFLAFFFLSFFYLLQSITAFMWSHVAVSSKVGFGTEKSPVHWNPPKPPITVL